MSGIEMANYLELLIKIISVISTFSFLSCLLVVYIFISKKHLRTFILELLFHLAISEMINSVAKFMSIYKLFYNSDITEGLKDQSSVFCYIQKILVNFSDDSSFIIIVIISYTLYRMMTEMSKDVKYYIVCFRIFIYFVPLGISFR